MLKIVVGLLAARHQNNLHFDKDHVEKTQKQMDEDFEYLKQLTTVSRTGMCANYKSRWEMVTVKKYVSWALIFQAMGGGGIFCPPFFAITPETLRYRRETSYSFKIETFLLYVQNFRTFDVGFA